MLRASLMRVWLVSYIYALLYLPQKCEADIFVLSQFRDIVYATVLLTVHIQFFGNIFCLYFSHFDHESDKKESTFMLI